MSEITISQLSKSTGLSSSAIRYYVQEGLIHTIGRDGLQRVFHDSVLQQLKLIILGKKAGFSLVEIKKMMANKQEPINKALLTLKANEIKEKIIELQVLHNTLEHVANCPHQNPLECEKFQKILNQVF